MMPIRDIAPALDSHDFRRAGDTIRAWLTKNDGAPITIFNLGYLAKYVMHTRDWEVRNLILDQMIQIELSPHDTIDHREGVAAVCFHLGVSYLPENEHAVEWLEKALVAAPDFLPARVELEIIRCDLDRNAVLNCLAKDIPLLAWCYEAAAAWLGLPANRQPRALTGETRPSVGLAIRGRCLDTTPALLRFYRRAIGNRPLYLATWDDTKPEILHAAHDVCDKVVLMPDVQDPGRQNRVRQIVLSQQAIAAAIPQCDLLLLTRTDVAIFRPGILDILAGLWATFPIADQQLRGRIVVSDIYTRKYTPDHPADIVMFGATGDLMKFWGCPASADIDPDLFPERYLSRQFRLALDIFGGKADLTKQEYWTYIRDYFIVRDFAWLEAWWLDHGGLQRAASGFRDYEDLITQGDWEAMQFSSPNLPHEYGWATTLRGALLGSLFPRKIG